MFNGREQLDWMNTSNADLADHILSYLDERGIDVTVEKGTRTQFELVLARPGGESCRYELSIDRNPRPNAVFAMHEAAKSGQPRLLLAPYMTTSLAQNCRDLNVSFADAAGNAFLRWPGVYIDVEGKPRDPRFTMSMGTSGRRTFDPAGIKILFSLLTFPDLIKQPYRTIASSSTASLGTTQMVLKELEHDGYVDLGARTLHRTRELYDKWLDAFLINLQPKLGIGLYRIDEPDRILGAGLPEEVVWGGEAAVAQSDNILRPETVMVYSERRPTALLAQWKARRADSDEDANLFVRRRFWTRNDFLRLAPSTLIQADLMASGDPRQADAAIRLRRGDALLRRIDAG